METFCRICFTQSKTFSNLFFTSEYNLTFAEMVFICTRVLIQEDDEPDSSICDRCISMLNTSYEFYRMCKLSESAIKEQYDSSNSFIKFEHHNDQRLINEHITNKNMVNVSVFDETVLDSDPKQTPKQDSSNKNEVKKKFKKSKKPKTTKKSSAAVEKKFECYKCKMSTKSRWDTIKHLRNHDALAKYKCSVCDIRFVAKDLLFQHICMGNEIYCEYCSEKFTTTIDLVNHLEIHEEKRLHRCTKCPQFFAMSILLEHHLNKHPFCSKQNDETTKVFICNICNKRFSTIHLLYQHSVIHKNDRPFLCPECGKGFKTTSSLATHRIGHREKTLKCPDCPMTFNRIGNFKKHRDVHSNITYICNICQAELQSRYAHRNHMRRHRLTDEDKRHQCQYCPMKFHRKCKLVSHIRTHTGEKPHKCEYCDRAYAQKCDLTKHLRRAHLGDYIYKCELCDEAFKFYNDMKKHLLDHYKLQKQQENSEMP